MLAGLKHYTILGLFGVVLLITACSPTFVNHGYTPVDTELETLKVGVDTRDSVAEAVGRPSASGVLGEDTWYFVSSRIRNFAYKAPETIERQVLAISFAKSGRISNIERFTLEDGRVVALSRRITRTSIKGVGIVGQLLGNIGNFDPASILR
jgi:outer membrane protein assembly factor BamE (lipoprotein component of BamABCDE complex)